MRKSVKAVKSIFFSICLVLEIPALIYFGALAFVDGFKGDHDFWGILPMALSFVMAIVISIAELVRNSNGLPGTIRCSIFMKLFIYLLGLAFSFLAIVGAEGISAVILFTFAAAAMAYLAITSGLLIPRPPEKIVNLPTSLKASDLCYAVVCEYCTENAILYADFSREDRDECMKLAGVPGEYMLLWLIQNDLVSDEFKSRSKADDLKASADNIEEIFSRADFQIRAEDVKEKARDFFIRYAVTLTVDSVKKSNLFLDMLMVEPVHKFYTVGFDKEIYDGLKVLIDRAYETESDSADHPEGLKLDNDADTDRALSDGKLVRHKLKTGEELLITPEGALMLDDFIERSKSLKRVFPDLKTSMDLIYSKKMRVPDRIDFRAVRRGIPVILGDICVRTK